MLRGATSALSYLNARLIVLGIVLLLDPVLIIYLRGFLVFFHIPFFYLLFYIPFCILFYIFLYLLYLVFLKYAIQP